MSRAGSREKRYRPKVDTGFGRINDNKVGILVTSITRQLAIVALDPETWDAEHEVKIASEKGDNITLLITIPGRPRPLAWNLSGMTTEELEATRKFFDFLFDLADPIVRERDKVAQDARDQGDDSYIRVYRTLPQFFTRKRTKRTDGESVHDGPEDASDGLGDGGDNA